MAIHAVLSCIQPVHIPCPFEVPFLPHHTHCCFTLVADSVVKQSKSKHTLFPNLQEELCNLGSFQSLLSHTTAY